MKYWIVVFALSLISCSVAQTQLSTSTETPIPSTSTPQVVEVTRVINVIRTVVVTTTPEPLLAHECFNTAQSQRDLNNCANLEAELAKTELESIISEIQFPPETKTAFDKLQVEWEELSIEECRFFYGQIIEDDDGSIRYAGGSMSPMQIGFCIADKYKKRTQELKYAYLNN